MWCVAEMTPEYVGRMHKVVDTYGLPHDPAKPVVCVDEKSKQIISDSPNREPIPMKPGSPEKVDYEYVRKGTCNLFVAVEPKGGKRVIEVTERRTKKDFVKFIRHLANVVYKKATKISIVLDNLNTHFEKSFIDILGTKTAKKLLKRVEFIYTPKHASWLNIAEIEIGIMDKQCLNRRFNDLDIIKSEVKAWSKKRNKDKKKFNWTFTKEKADLKLGKYYVT